MSDTPKKEATPKAKKQLIVSVHGDMPHLFRPDVVFTSNPVPVEMDNFIEVQIGAGKLVVYQEEQ